MEPITPSPNPRAILATHFPNIHKLAESLSNYKTEKQVKNAFKHKTFDAFLNIFENLVASYDNLEIAPWKTCIRRINIIFKNQTETERDHFKTLQNRVEAKLGRLTPVENKTAIQGNGVLKPLETMSEFKDPLYLQKVLKECRNDNQLKQYFKHSSMNDFLSQFENIVSSYESLDPQIWSCCIERINLIFKKPIIEANANFMLFKNRMDGLINSSLIKSQKYSFTNPEFLKNYNTGLNIKEFTKNITDPQTLAKTYSFICNALIFEKNMMNQLLFCKLLQENFEPKSNMELQNIKVGNEIKKYWCYSIPKSFEQVVKNHLNCPGMHWGTKNQKPYFYLSSDHSKEETFSYIKIFENLRYNIYPPNIFLLQLVIQIQSTIIKDYHDHLLHENDEYYNSTSKRFEYLYLYLNNFIKENKFIEFIENNTDIFSKLCPLVVYYLQKLPIEMPHEATVSKKPKEFEANYHIYNALGGFNLLLTDWSENHHCRQEALFEVSKHEISKLIENHPDLKGCDTDYTVEVTMPLGNYPEWNPLACFDERLYKKAPHSSTKKSSASQKTEKIADKSKSLPKPKNSGAIASSAAPLQTADSGNPMKLSAIGEYSNDQAPTAPKEKEKSSIFQKPIKAVTNLKKKIKNFTHIASSDDIAFAKQYFHTISRSQNFFEASTFQQESHLLQTIPGKKHFFDGWAPTVQRWHDHEYGQNLPAQKFPEYAHYRPEEQKMHHLMHEANPFVNRFLDLGIKGTWANEETESVYPCIRILGEMTINGQRILGAFEYTYNSDTFICFHKWFKGFHALPAEEKNIFSEVLNTVASPENATQLPSRPQYIPRYNSIYSTDEFGTVTIQDEEKGILIRLFDSKKLTTKA